MKLILIIGFFLGFTATNVFAETDTICWTPPTERIDNTPLLPTDIGGYNLHASTGIVVQEAITGTCATVQAASVPQTFYVTAYDTDGRTSQPSVLVTVEAGKAIPKPPTGFTVTRSISDASMMP